MGTAPVYLIGGGNALGFQWHRSVRRRRSRLLVVGLVLQKTRCET